MQILLRCIAGCCSEGNQAKRGRAVLSRAVLFLRRAERAPGRRSVRVVALGIGPPALVVMDDDLRRDEERSLGMERPRKT